MLSYRKLSEYISIFVMLTLDLVMRRFYKDTVERQIGEEDGGRGCRRLNKRQ